MRRRFASTAIFKCRNNPGAYCTSSRITGCGCRCSKATGSFSACSASLGKSRETKRWSGNSRRRVEVLPVCRAPVTTTTGRVLTHCRSRGSTLLGIHMREKCDAIAYEAFW
jgi:hypothetical protein